MGTHLGDYGSCTMYIIPVAIREWNSEGGLNSKSDDTSYNGQNSYDREHFLHGLLAKVDHGRQTHCQYEPQ